MGWPTTPSAPTASLRRVRDDYRPAEILVTENGASYSDGPGPAGTIHHARRIEYLQAHVAAMDAARDDGVPVTGYFVWSLLDNLEWSLGYTQRFGLVWVDFETGRRVPKDSFEWYRRLIPSRRGG